jgi:predicted nuclease of restriction endonuclease-like (RecB) superfamily
MIRMEHPSHTPDFNPVFQLIRQARYNAYKAVNTELIHLYWEIGKYISERTDFDGWGKSTVSQLAHYIKSQEPESKGFSDKHLWRMKQFYEIYSHAPKLSTLLRELSWSHNLLIFSRCKTEEEREFYLRLTKKESYSFRELERQINASYYERMMLGSAEFQQIQQRTAVSQSFPQEFEHIFKERYVLDFLHLPEQFNETDLKKGLVRHMKNFLLELGKDFLFMGEEYRLHVGNKDFFIDLVFYHRQLQCLVAFELKTTDFSPEHIGQLNFYLEALDRDVKKPHENPSIGILLCKSKDNEVVEYALSRNLSPAMVSEYHMALPDKKLLQAKLHELLELWEQGKEDE